ncbi:uncharacterized protein LTR77_005275 [Saxophila tyrrhenica]|uniref:ER membrane protein complex subunit 1 n=1 Tax=Saxophila tyrrhenica TaxID=1690608 RepID=A0AAV9PFS7_9PEZI|nr:hypothetical protein LTR77_005275 [Saxophila tyrrhenica]
MMRIPLIAAACLLLKTTSAVFADEAYNVDYHYALLGQPQQDTTFFHRPSTNSKASLLYTLSEKGVVGAVNPRDGEIVWRHALAQNVTERSNGFLRAADGQDVVVSGSGSRVAAWTAADGRLAWDMNTDGPVEDVEILELSDKLASAGNKDVLVLSSGDSPAVQRIDGASGTKRWQFKVEGGDLPYQVSASSTEVFVILLHKTMLGYYKIRVVSLDSVDGHKTDEYTLSSDSELATAETILSVGANSASPIIAWTDAAYTTLKVNIIGTKSTSSFNIEKHDDRAVEKISIQAPYHTNSLAHFLVHYETANSHWADVFHINLSKNKIEKAYSLPKVAGKGAFSTSVSDANVYFTRITEDEITTTSSSSHGILGRWKAQGLGIDSGTSEVITPTHAVSELSIKNDAVSAIRTAVSLSTGDWMLLRDGSPVWNRPEALADISSATFATSSAIEELEQELEVEAHSNAVAAYVHRMKRHIEELKYLPRMLMSLPQRFMRGFLGTSSEGGMAKDAFGFHQILACATASGRLIALDAGSPDRVLWNRQATTLQAGKTWRPQLTSQADVLILHQGQGGQQLAFNATNGHLLLAPPPREAATTGPNVQYTMTDDGLEAKRLDVENAGSLWHFTPSSQDRIHSLVPRPVNDPVANIGKVLGDRRVLYKYLNPNVALLATTNDASKTASVYVLDTLSGAILHSTTHTSVDLADPISSIMSENWFAYTLTTSADPRGHLLIVGELFESLIPNDRGSLQSAANFSTLETSPEPFALTATYQIPESVSKLAVTRTKQGITSRHLLAYTPASDGIVSIPYSILDPRRPVNRDPTKDELAEGLVRYAPVIEFDPRWYLNHARSVIGINEVLTSPAFIESTSLVFAYGHDIFGTRVGPSGSFDVLGRDFNKFQMLATVVGLAAATVGVAPLVMRKGVDARWRFT